MRRFLRRFTVPIIGIIVLGLLAIALGVGTSSDRRDGATAGGRPAVDRLEPYRGLASWVDLWDKRAWRDPAAAVKDMADHGVRTIFIQTGNARSSGGISNPSAMREFITEAHKRQMFVVAWYLPSLKTGSVDYERVVQAVEFETEDGQRFDSFALDIESTAVKPISARNRNLVAFSQKIRDRVGPDYPLGAIIPSPVGLKKQSGFWDVFPYKRVAETYDVLVPMAYYSYDSRNAKQAREYALSSMRILRAQPGCSEIPVHLIGGIAGKSSAAEVRAFAAAARETDCIGTSIYDWAGMNDARWRGLAAGWGSGAK